MGKTIGALGSGPVASALSRRTILAGAAGLATTVAVGAVAATPAEAAQQGNWRWCNRCQCFFYNGNYTTGWCPRGGGHNYEGSGNYQPHYDYDEGEDDWRWCRKCQCMWYGGGSNNSDCPAGGRHSRQGSGNYSFEYGSDNDDDEQTGWRKCRKCYCMCYSGNGNGYCPQGGSHNYNGSRRYYIPFD